MMEPLDCLECGSTELKAVRGQLGMFRCEECYAMVFADEEQAAPKKQHRTKMRNTGRDE